MMNSQEEFEKLLRDANQPFMGWDFSYLSKSGRMKTEPLPWDYKGVVVSRLSEAKSLLDMGTGGGEILSSLVPLPEDTYATEAYGPNVLLAKKKLEPLGVKVVEITADKLPFEDGRFDLVINRHESYLPKEVLRVLKSGGEFITQQVGEKNNQEINEALGAAKKGGKKNWNLANAGREIESVSLSITERNEALVNTSFSDVGAVVYYLKAVPWQVPNFTVDEYREELYEIHESIQERGHFETTDHRFYLIARKR